jgi:hypothetical protein
MCTVSYFPFADGFRIVSSRDEKKRRKPANQPALYRYEKTTVLYPEDGEAGGSWIGMQSNGYACVLLNGGFMPHIAQPPYRMSRGLVFLAILSAASPLEAFHALSLQDIEPFTLIIASGLALHECRWDGWQKHCKAMNPRRPYIWSSVTLYNPVTIAKREQWFNGWIQQHTSHSLELQMLFHNTGGEGDRNNDIRMNRADELFTVSISGMEITREKGSMLYRDLVQNTASTHQLIFQNSYIPA